MLPLLILAATPSLPFLSPVFGDHMVLQRDRANTFWGWTTPGARVRVSVAGRRAEGIAGPDGKWTARLNPPKVGGPYQVVVEGPSRVELKDVLVGDVWLCTGQSNMEMGLTLANDGVAEAKAAEEPQIRLAMAPHQVGYAPAAINPLAWQACTPATVTQGGWGGFSAVGYYFGRELQRKLKVPIGLVQMAWGGTSAEAWTSAEGLRPLGDFNRDLEKVESLRGRGLPLLGTYTDLWLAENDPGVREGWHRPEAADASWKPATVPGRFEARGSTWFRREFTLPDPLPAGDGRLLLGQINETDTVWVNGHLLGTTSFEWAWRQYVVPREALRAGKNVIAIRVFNPRATGAFLSPAERIVLQTGEGGSLPLAGEWKTRLGVETKEIATKPRDFEPNPSVPSLLANGMVAPLAPLTIRGAIWYQGETNSGRGWQYRRLLPALIADWRRAFGQGDFPFYIVSLANYQARAERPGDDWWAELREAQALTAAKVPNSGLAITIDIGDADDVHPKEKRTVGERLALQALAKQFGDRVEYSGPTYRSMKIDGPAVRLRFEHVGKGLVLTKDGARTGFAVAGEDRKWYWAEARVEGGEVVVSAPEVPRPKAVRYAWAMNPLATLKNADGLPAVPFRTDGWPAVSAANR
ncbi:MAG: sialate O-acetylesterase [Fimbriimonas sp.]